MINLRKAEEDDPHGHAGLLVKDENVERDQVANEVEHHQADGSVDDLKEGEMRRHLYESGSQHPLP